MVRWWTARRRSRAGRRAVLSAAVVAAIAGTIALTAPWAVADDTTASQDNLRTGWDPNEPKLGPAAVAGDNFGQLFATKVQGQVYGQPLVVGNTVVVGTEDDYAYGLDAATGTVKWQRSLGRPWPSSTIGCGDLAPNLGNTSAGVYDPASGFVYLTTKVNDGPDANHPNWYLHAVSAATGAERTGWPIKIAGTPANDPAHPFTPYDVNERPGLLLLDGTVYMAFGSHCDYGHYVGWVAGVSTGSGAVSMWSDEVGATSSEAGIWQGGGGVMSDGSGRIFVATGNGVTAPDGPGANPPQQLSEAVVRLGVGTGGTLSAKDFFSPTDAATLDRNDQDLGSGGPVGLPAPYFGTSALPHLMVEIGKDGRLFLLNRDHLGGKNQKSGGGNDVVQTVGPYNGVWGHPAAYGGDGGYVYVVQNNNSMLAFKYSVDGAGNPAFSLAGNTLETFGGSSGSPIVTSDATTPGSGLVWVVNVDGPNGANARLSAYRAVPSNNRLALVRQFPIGTGVKFSTPASSNGRVYVGTRDGLVYGFGQPVGSALDAPQTGFGNVDVGASATATVTATATRAVTVNAVSSAGAPFTVSGASTPALPATLAAGQKITVPVTFAPTVPGSTSGALNFQVLDGGIRETLGAALQGNAVKAGLTPNPDPLDFGPIAVGTTKSLAVSFTNTGLADETVGTVTAPAGPYTVTGLPAPGAVVAPGQSVVASVTYQPTGVGTDAATIAVTSTSGTTTAHLTGQGVTGHAELTIDPTSLDFGTVTVGSPVTKTLTVRNTGNLDVTITKAAPPTLPFVVDTPLPEGQVLTPDDEVQVQVTFAPTAPGTFSNHYLISSNDGNGAHDVPVTGTAVTPPDGTPLPALARGGWVFNGNATAHAGKATLTTAAGGQTGSAVYSTPLASNGLNATFVATIGGGNGADGMTFALLAASGSSAHSIGGGGSGLGFSGLPGVAVVLNTFKHAGDPAANFVGLSDGGSGATLHYVATATNVPSLRSGPHAVSVAVSGTTVTVALDGVQRLSANMPVAPSVLPAFTAATGAAYDQHAVSAVTIASGDTTLPAPGTGWRFNGAAGMNGAQTVLTPAQGSLSGNALYSDPVATDRLTAQFRLTMTGGNGADGAAFALLDPAKATASSLGVGASGVGFAGLGGTAVGFHTSPAYGVNSSNFVDVESGTDRGPVKVVAVNTNVPDLRASPHTVTVQVVGPTVTVALDGTQVLTASVPTLTPTGIVGFTGGTGQRYDVHIVSDAQIVVGRTAVTMPADGNWSLNGSTVLAGGLVTLTPAAAGKTGTAIFMKPVPTAHLRAEFTTRIGGGTGADGLTFMLLDPAGATPQSVGGGGGGLGFRNLPGVGVSFVTYAQTGDPSNNFVGIGPGTGQPVYTATTTAVPNLRSGDHDVRVSTGDHGDLVVSVDGVQVLDTVVPVPATALVGFSGATGSVTDLHAINDVRLSY